MRKQAIVSSSQSCRSSSTHGQQRPTPHLQHQLAVVVLADPGFNAQSCVLATAHLQAAALHGLASTMGEMLCIARTGSCMQTRRAGALGER
jgi:hypothetical protein